MLLVAGLPLAAGAGTDLAWPRRGSGGGGMLSEVDATGRLTLRPEADRTLGPVVAFEVEPEAEAGDDVDTPPEGTRAKFNIGWN